MSRSPLAALSCPPSSRMWPAPSQSVPHVWTPLVQLFAATPLLCVALCRGMIPATTSALLHCQAARQAIHVQPACATHPLQGTQYARSVAPLLNNPLHLPLPQPWHGRSLAFQWLWLPALSSALHGTAALPNDRTDLKLCSLKSRRWWLKTRALSFDALQLP